MRQRQYTPPYNRSVMLPRQKRYGQKGGGIVVRRKRLGGTIFGTRGERYPHIPEWYKRQIYQRRARRTRR